MTELSLTQPDIEMLTVADDAFDAPPTTGEMCDVCGKGPYKNMGRHMTVHKVDGTATSERVSVTRRVQKDVSGKGAPTVDQLTVASGRLLGYGSIAISSMVVDDDPRPMSEEQKDQLVDALSVTPDEAKDIMRPLARIFAGTTLNKRVGRKIVDNMDAADSVVALLMISRRWSQYMSERNQYTKAVAGGNVTVAPPVEAQRIAVQDQQSGVVVTPDMVAAMRNGR